MTKTVKIIGDPTNPRVALFANLLGKSEEFTLDSTVEPVYSLTGDYNIISGLTSKSKTLPSDFFTKSYNGSHLIFDADKDLFEDPKIGATFTLLVVCSSFVTCANEFIQERIYEYTGRLAALVRSPMDLSTMQGPDIRNTKDYLWYGEPIDIFSIVKLAKQSPNITVACTGTLNNTENIVNISSVKKKKKVLDKFDVVLLPPVSPEREEARQQKVLECYIQGKAIIESPLKKLNKKALTNAVLEAQHNIRELYGEQASLTQLETALTRSPDDDFCSFLDLDDGENYNANKLR